MGKTARTARRAVSVLSHLFAAFAAFQAGLVYDIHRGARDLSTTSCRYYGAWRSFSDNPHRQQDAPRGVPPGSSLIPSSITKLMVGASTLNVSDFAGSFPSGFSNFAMQDPKASNVTKGHSHVLLLHQHPSSLPPHQPHRDGATASTAPRAGSWSRIPHLPLPGAASRCRVVKHVLTNLGNARGDRNRRSCTALVGQRSDSYHVNKWLNDPNITRADRLVRVNRYQYAAAHDMFNGLFRRVPDRLMRRDGLKILGEYLSAFDGAMERLGPVAARVADAGSPAVRGNIIVLVCNFGHAELFANFVCAARAGGVDLSKMLMFATDPETHELAMSLGIASFHDAGIFASIPRDASRMYGNDHYAKIMMSKVYCVHMISQLGYNLLFQDVDIMIYQANYLEWFVEKAAAENHDIFFQHDFSDRAEYAPWVSNSGCYYAVNNERTQAMFTEMIYQGDRVSSCKSHQATLHTVLSELANLHALRVKNLRDDHEKLPIGWHYQRNMEFMRDMIQHGKSKQMSFHMNWNEHKDRKRQFLEQMGDWYLKPACANASSWDDIRAAAAANDPPSVLATCCSETPLIRCNWRDKPSVIPCRDSPFLDTKKRRSFW